MILSADDYGLTPGISEGIRQLLRQRRLTATAAMTVSPFWAEEGASFWPGQSRSMQIPVCI
ncbi:ChbG/HpnK family deacetylase [Pannonibacter sp. Pt2-lr]